MYKKTYSLPWLMVQKTYMRQMTVYPEFLTVDLDQDHGFLRFKQSKGIFVLLPI